MLEDLNAILKQPRIGVYRYLSRGMNGGEGIGVVVPLPA